MVRTIEEETPRQDIADRVTGDPQFARKSLDSLAVPRVLESKPRDRLRTRIPGLFPNTEMIVPHGFRGAPIESENHPQRLFVAPDFPVSGRKEAHPRRGGLLSIICPPAE